MDYHHIDKALVVPCVATVSLSLSLSFLTLQTLSIQGFEEPGKKLELPPKCLSHYKTSPHSLMAQN